ncbi:YlcI/YnfO family protein [Pseudonocardia sp. ICBG1142]|uniref:YlcI/YnfO family protein n=1 Tax=Pseudonocardia sp. ICBG1142 TaxID=2846760 RepID=UPI001CF6AB2F|nr:YlcI/YnfO family protein [Pseudonocardia sp. ICBG1142]
MSTQITVRLDDGLHEHAIRAAAEAGTTLSDWIRTAVARQAATAKALRARAEEDAHPAVYRPEQEQALMADRRRRAATTLHDT